MRAIVTGIEHFLSLQPLTVQCDSCNDQYRPRNQGFYKWGGQKERDRTNDALREEGWIVDGDTHTCPTCRKGLINRAFDRVVEQHGAALNALRDL